jgi:hypothetical protein
MAWLLVPAAAFLLVAWYAVAGRHPARSVWNAMIVSVVTILLIVCGAVSLGFIIRIGFDERVGNAVSTLIVALLIVAGTGLVVRTVRRKPPLHVLLGEDESRLRAVRLCAWITALYFLALPALTYVALIANYGGYSANRLRDSSVPLSSAFQIVLYDSHLPFFATAWWAFIALHLAVSRTTARWEMSRRGIFSVSLVAITLFSLPYALLMYVLAFDTMERDFPPLQELYSNFFTFVAPVLGLLLAAGCLAVTWLARKRSIVG